MQIQNIFPTPIFSQTIDVSPWLNKAAELVPDDQFLKNYQSHRPWCTEDDLHHRPEFSGLTAAILDMAAQSLDAMGILRQDHYISSMWLNAQHQQSNQQAHAHPNSILSGCCYLQVPEHSQYIHFYDPRPAAGVWHLRKAIVDDHYAVHPHQGLTMMWPSWLLHSTQSTTVKELSAPRITISWNIMIRDEIDQHSIKLKLS